MWLKQRYPLIRYSGTDISAEMIAQAREMNPDGAFNVHSFVDNDFGAFDIVLVSQVMES